MFSSTTALRTITLASAMAVTSAATAGRITRWGFENDGATLTANTFNFPVTASAMAFGSGASQAAGSFGNVLALDTYMSTDESSALADAMSNDSYIEFGVTTDAGWSLDLNMVKFRLSGYDPDGEVTPPSVAWALRTDLDNFASDIGTGTNGVEFTEYEVEKISFSNLGFDTDSLQSITFRLYLSHWGTTSPTGAVVDQIQLNGQMVPGPGGLLALTGMCLARRRRRR